MRNELWGRLAPGGDVLAASYSWWRSSSSSRGAAAASLWSSRRPPLPVDVGPEPVGEPDTAEKASDDLPTLDREIAHLVDVRAAAHAATEEHPAFDRVVLEFEGTEPPTWRVTYVDPPVREDPTGHRVDVAGQAFLELRLEPASAVDLTDEEPVETYPGPDRIPIDGHLANEAVQIGDFESNHAWVVGIDRQAPFAVAFFGDPLRLVVDVVDTE